MKTKAKKLVHVRQLSDLEWLQYRQAGIGGSDAAGIVGLNKYKSPLNVYIDKVEEITSSEIPSEAAEWGHRLEPTVRSKFKDNHPELTIKRSFIMWQHQDYPFMLANVDGIVYDAEKGWGVLEIKTSSEWRKDEWSESEVPEEYLIQMQHYLAVMGFDYGYFAVLIGGNKYREFYIERDEELVESLIQIESNFWNGHVLNQEPPEPDGSTSSAEVLNRLYPSEDAYEKTDIIELGEEAKALAKDYDDVLLQEKEIAKRKKELQNKMKKLLGEYQVGSFMDGEDERQIKWTVSRSFNESKLKEGEPDKYKEFEKTALDKAGFKKKYPKVYNEYMSESDKRSFSVKEDEADYMGVA